MKLDINSCARCGKDHKKVPLHRFTQQCCLWGEVFDYWAMCPVLSEPILVTVRDRDKPCPEPNSSSTSGSSSPG